VTSNPSQIPQFPFRAKQSGKSIIKGHQSTIMVVWLLTLPSAGFSLVSGRPHITSRCTVSPLVSMVAVSKLSVTARNVEMTDPLRAFADAKLSKPIERHDGMLAAVTLTLKVQHRGLHDTDHIGYDAHRAEVSATCTDGHSDDTRDPNSGT
jgi:hypothetical protein